MAARHKAIGVALVVGGCYHKQAASIFQTVRHDPAQHFIFVRALGGRLRVFHHVAPAAVQQAVVAPAGAVGQVALFHQHRAHAAQRQVAQHAHASGAAANHQNISVYGLHSLGSCLHFLSATRRIIGMSSGRPGYYSTCSPALSPAAAAPRRPCHYSGKKKRVLMRNAVLHAPPGPRFKLHNGSLGEQTFAAGY